MAYSTGKKNYFYLLLAFFALVFFHYVGWLLPAEKFVRSISVPRMMALNTLSVDLGDHYEIFRNKTQFISAYRQCLTMAGDKISATSAILLLNDENAELRKLLSFHKKNAVPLLTARVVGRELLTTDQTIIIDEGSDSGLAVGLSVITGEGIMVGKISKVEQDTATVRLINDNQSKVSVAVLNADRSIGVVEGGYGISLLMNLIPRDESVRVGDTIVSSGLDTLVPRGLLIGTVAVIENEPYKPFQQAVLTPITDLGKLSIVSVLLAK